MFPRIFIGALLGLAAFSDHAFAQSDGDEVRARYLRYESCMGEQVARFARKASTADEAIAGARATCSTQRDEIRESVVVKNIVDTASSPGSLRPFSERASEEHADRVLVRLDAGMRDALVKRYLESK